MKTTFFKKAAMFVALPIATLAILAGVVSAQSTGITGPMFNIHDNVDGVGDESDFLRIRKTDGTKVNTIEACEGEVSFWIYIHNGQSTLNNGTNFDGSGVAKNTRVNLQPLPTTYGKNHQFTSTITADNAADVSDTANITCGSSDVKVEYQSIEQFYKYDPTATQGYALTGDITSNQGALVGFNGGVVPGCWEYRAIVLVKVKIVKKPVEPVVKKECVIADVKKLSRTRYQITANAKVENATVSNYVFTTKNASGAVVDTKTFTTSALAQAYEVEQTTPGTYTVKAVINTNKGVADGVCETTFKVDEVPTTPSYSCDDFKFDFVDRKATVSFVPQASNGATFKDATIVYYADGSEKNTITTNAITNGRVVSTYTYDANAKNVQAKATVRFNIGSGKDMVTKEVKCEGKAVLGATTPPPTTTIPDTGAGSTMAIIFAITAAAGTFLHRKFTLNR